MGLSPPERDVRTTDGCDEKRSEFDTIEGSESSVKGKREISGQTWAWQTITQVAKICHVPPQPYNGISFQFVP
jgi:hypothetical protein